MSAPFFLAGAALGAVVTAAATRRRTPPPTPVTEPDRHQRCTCGCLALQVQVAHWRQQAGVWQRLAKPEVTP